MTRSSKRLVAITAALTVALLGAGAALGGAALLYGGYYNVAATRQHFQWVHTLLEQGMHYSVRRHASEVVAPPGLAQPDAGMLRRGAGLYRDNCVTCHGAPGVAPADIGKSMQPAPGPLVDAARRWKPAELYWITRHGIRMSGMPAWEYRLAEDDLWLVAGFLAALPRLTPAAYRELVDSSGAVERAPRPDHAAPDARRGRMALTQYACQSCHIIPGVTGPDTHVGPPLKDLAARQTIAGILPNSAANLAHWLRDPAAVHPQTAMPALQVTASDARDMAAYLLAP